MTPLYSLQPLTRTDGQLVRKMLYHALYVPKDQPPFLESVVDAPSLAKYFLDWGRRGDDGLVAIEGTTLRPLGAAWVRLFTGDDRGYGYVDDETPELSIAVLPGYRGRGIGTRLLDELIEKLEPRFRAVSLSVSADNPAVSLYLRLGFNVLSQNGTTLTMKKILRKSRAER